MMNRLAASSFLLLLTLLATAGCGGRTEAIRSTAVGEPGRVIRGDLERSLLLTGDMIAEDAVVLVGPQVNIWPLQIRWLIDDGGLVQPGDPVVEFDNSQLVSNLDEMRVRVVEAENLLATTIAEGEAAVGNALFEVERCRASHAKAEIDTRVPEGLLALREMGKRRLEVEKWRLELVEAGFKLEQQRRIANTDAEIQRIALNKARAEVSRAEADATRLTLRAPCAGIVIIAHDRREDRTFQTGDTTWPGSVVARLPDLSTMIVDARLFDVDDGRITAGMAVTATLDAFPERVFNGTVREIDPFAKETSWNSLRRCSRTLVEIEDLDVERMLPGMSVKLQVWQPPLRGVLLAPRTSISWRQNKPWLVLEGGSTVEVALGPCDGSFCVVEEGAREGTALGFAEVVL